MAAEVEEGPARRASLYVRPIRFRTLCEVLNQPLINLRTSQWNLTLEDWYEKVDGGNVFTWWQAHKKPINHGPICTT